MDRETTYDLRMDMELKDETINKRLTDHRTTDLDEKKTINDDIKNLDNKCDDFRATYDEFTIQATKLTDQSCNETFSNCMEVVLSTKGDKEITAADKQKGNTEDGQIERH